MMVELSIDPDKTQREKSPGFALHYANHVTVMVTDEEAQFLFGYGSMKLNKGSKEPVIYEEAVVAMPLKKAIELMGLLQTSLTERFGEGLQGLKK